jgi:hypothetical protein
VRVQLTDGSLTEKAFNLETDCAALEVALREHPDVRLIVIDPSCLLKIRNLTTMTQPKMLIPLT